MKIGIDLGGTKIELIALDNSVAGETLEECYRKRVLTPQGNYQKTICAIVDLINEAESFLNKKATIGVGIPGAISMHTGLVKNANSVCLIGRPLQQDLEKLLQRPIRINNDANCMTVSEASDGAGQDASIVFGVILGTGTGAGIAINKQVLTGKNMIAGEWGHNPMPWLQLYDQPEIDCYCGKQNCIETFLSGPGLLKRFKYIGGQAKSVEELILQLEAGNKLALWAMENYESQLARSLASIINIIDPDVIVLAGGLSNILRLYNNVPKLWQQFVFSDQVNTQLKIAQYGDSSGVRGAAWLW
ncbi:MAG: ROK family protein [Pseudomonadota bacterium]